MSYAKLFGSILDSSIWQESKETKVLWITMLAMKDRDGLVEAAIPGLAKRAGLTIQETMTSLQVLLSPDPWSRTPDHEGRRIEAVPGGWRVLNHDEYRHREDLEERREKAAERQRKSRARRAPEDPDVTGSHTSSQAVTASDTEAEADRGSPSENTGSVPVSKPPDLSGGGDLLQGAAYCACGAPSCAKCHPTTADVSRATPGCARPPLAPAVLQDLVTRFRGAISAARRRIAEDHRLQGVRAELPLHGGENETELRQRLKDAGPEAEDQLRHVIAVAIAEAEQSGDVRWLGWNLGRSRAWDRALRTTPQLTRKPQQPAQRSAFDAAGDVFKALAEREQSSEPPDDQPPGGGS